MISAEAFSKDKQRFTDLLRNLTHFDENNRRIIDETITQSVSLESFLKSWQSLSVHLSDDTHLRGSVEAASDRNPATGEESNRFLCHLFLDFRGQDVLQLQFWVKDAPLLQHETYASPIRAYNTKVTVQRAEGFKPFEYYDTIMYLLKKILPTDTKLLLYVRQKDSREILDNGGDPRSVPLSIVFQKAGWTFQSYHDDKVTKDPLRRHRLILKS